MTFVFTGGTGSILFCGIINAWSESGQSENDDYSVLNVTTIFDDDGKELKKILNIGLGKENQVILNIQVDSASPVSFLKKNVLHELKLRDPYLKIYRWTKQPRIFTVTSLTTL